jgi:hypothetical protein
MRTRSSATRLTQPACGVWSRSLRRNQAGASDGLVPQSEAAFQSALSAYQSNKQDFESLLSGFIDVLNLDLEYRNELVEHESALAELERLTGVDLP